MGIIVLLCGICLVFGCFRTCSSGACMGLEFTFPQLKNDTFSVQEHNNETFSFEVRGKRCRNVSFHVIKDTCIGDSLTTSRKILCMIHLDYLKDGKCVCERHTDSGPRLTCNFTDEFDRDVGELVFESKLKTPGKSKCVRINVLYPTTISNFTTTPSHELRENETVVVNCSWVNGNPQPRILIRNPKNQTIASQHPDNQVLNAAIFEGNITCSDSGQYRCEAEGTDQYKAVDLMVKCPPRIMNDTEEKEVVLGSSAVFHFDVISYNNLTLCTLEGPKKNGPRNCSSDKTETTISGTPPRLRLEIKVKNVREDDEGTWQLTVGNGFVDHDTANFTLHQDKGKHGGEANDIWTVVIVCVTFSVASAVLCVAIVVTTRRTRRRKREYRTGAKKKIHRVCKPTPQVEEPLIDTVNEDIMTHMNANNANLKAGTTLDKNNLDATKDARNEANLENGVGLPVTPREENGNCVGKMRQTTGESHNKTVDAPGLPSDVPESNANAQGTNPDSPQSNADAPKSDDNASAAQANGPSTNYDQGEIIIDARVPNAEGCLYGQLDFSGVKPRTSVIKDLPSTDYAQIDFNAPPPPPPLPEDSD